MYVPNRGAPPSDFGGSELMWTYCMYVWGGMQEPVSMSLAMRACGRAGGRVRSIHTWLAVALSVRTICMYCNSRIVTTVRMSMWSHVCIYLAVLCDYVDYLFAPGRPMGLPC